MLSQPSWRLNGERGWLPPIQNFPSWGKYCRSIRYPGMKDESPLRARGVLTAEREKILRAFDGLGDFAQQLLQVFVAVDEIYF